MTVDLMVRQFLEDVRTQKKALEDTWREIAEKDAGNGPEGEQLSWAMTYLVPTNKWLWSVDAGRDIGTPETVRRMIAGEDSENPTWYRLLKIEEIHTKAARDMLVVGYLTNFHSQFSILDSRKCVPVFGDTSARRPLIGELKRFLAQGKGLSDWEAADDAGALQITHYVVGTYCETHDLGGFYAFLQAAAMERDFWHINQELTNAQEKSLEAAVGKR